jgi:hypothetical protein
MTFRPNNSIACQNLVTPHEIEKSVSIRETKNWGWYEERTTVLWTFTCLWPNHYIFWSYSVSSVWEFLRKMTRITWEAPGWLIFVLQDSVHSRHLPQSFEDRNRYLANLKCQADNLSLVRTDEFKPIIPRDVELSNELVTDRKCSAVAFMEWSVVNIIRCNPHDILITTHKNTPDES